MKACSNCKLDKTLNNFTNLKSSSDGLNGTCKDCHKKMTDLYWEKNPDKLKRKKLRDKLKARYNITIEIYEEMIVEQKNCCAICNISAEKLPKRLHVDHDHISGTVRKLLCQNCNMALGLIRDDKTIAIKLAEYLVKHGK